MRGDPHVRFGGRAGETDRRRRRHRAPRPTLPIGQQRFPFPRLMSRELPVTDKEPLLADVVSGRRFAIAEMDGFHRNRWTNWIGLSGRVQPEWVDDLDRNGWTISGGIVICPP
jgi:hypothetical protein